MNSTVSWCAAVLVLASAPAGSTKTQTAKARIRTAVTKTQAAHASIAGLGGYSSTNLLVQGPIGFQFAHVDAFSDWVAMGVNWFSTNWGSAAECFYGCGQTATKWAAAPIAHTTLSSALSTGGPITSLPVNALTGTIPSGSTIYVLQGTGGLSGGTNTQAWVTTSQANPGATSIAVSSQTPGIAYPSGAPVLYGYSQLQAQLISTQAVANSHSVGGVCLMTVRLDCNGAFGTGDTVLAPWWDAEWTTGSGGVGTTLYAGVYNLAAAAASLGFDGLFFDSEGYTTPGDVGWEWNYSGNSHTQAATNTQAQADGQMFAQWLAAGWASAGTGTAPIVMVYVSAKAGFSGTVNNNGTPITAFTQGSMAEASDVADGIGGYGGVVTTWFWSGFCAANAASGMPQSVCFVSEILYRWNQQALIAGNSSQPAGETQTDITKWGQLLQYDANTIAAAIGQLAQAFNPTGWNYWYNKVFTTPAAWIDGSGTAQDPVDSLVEVKAQLGTPNSSVGAFPAWCNPALPVVIFQYDGGNANYIPAPPGVISTPNGPGFDYSTGTRNGGGAGSPSGFDYRSTMLNTNTAYLVDPTPPAFGTFTPASGGSHAIGALTITGLATTSNAVASIGYSVNGGSEQGAALTLNLLSGPAIPPTSDGWTSPWVWNTQFSAPVILVQGTNTVDFTVTSVSKRVTTYRWTVNVGNPTKSQTAAARIRLFSSQIQSGRSRVSTVLTAVQGGVARVLTARQTVQAAHGFIVGSALTAIQTASARVITAVTAAQSALGRVQVTPTATQGARARVLATLTASQAAAGRVQTAPTATQTARGRVAILPTAAQTGTARIHATPTATQAAVGRVSTALTATQTARGRVRILPTATQTAAGRIIGTPTKAQTALARLVSPTSPTAFQNAIARLRKTLTVTQTARARLQTAPTNTQVAHGRVLVTPTKTQVARSRVQILPTRTQQASARIHLTNQATQAAHARIRETFTATQPAHGRLQVLPTRTQAAHADILAQPTRTQTAHGRVAIFPTATQRAHASLLGPLTTTQQASARLTKHHTTATQQAAARVVSGKFTVTFGRVRVRWTFAPPTIRWSFGKDA